VAPDLLISVREDAPMSNEQEKTFTHRNAMSTKDIVQPARKPDEDERWIQDALEDDDVREILKCCKVQPQLLRQTMHPIIFVAAVAAALLTIAPAAFAADAVPKFDIAKNCKAEVADASGVGETMTSCMRDEEDAKRQLAERWAQFAKDDKSVCISETSMDGTPSYVELQTCLEIATDNKARLGK
jgi:hypothetical protein